MARSELEAARVGPRRRRTANASGAVVNLRRHLLNGSGFLAAMHHDCVVPQALCALVVKFAERLRL